MQNLDHTFTALGDVTRRSIIAKLADGEKTLSTLAAPFDMSQTAVSKHVRVLSDAGLVIIEKRGRSRHCRLNAAPMKDAMAWLNDYETFWNDNFASLSRHFEKKNKEKGQ